MATLASPAKKQTYEQVEYEQGLLIENCVLRTADRLCIRKAISTVDPDREQGKLAGAGKAASVSR